MSNDNLTQAVVNHARNDMANLPPAPAEVKQPGFLKQLWNNLRIGDGHLMGMIRLGGHELTQALAAFPDSNIKPMEEPGVFGNPTPQIVTQEMGKLDVSLSDAAHRAQFQTRDADRGIER